MSSDDPNLKRLNVILILFAFIFTIGICQAILLTDTDPYDAMGTKMGNVQNVDPPSLSITGLGQMLSFVGDFLAFMFGLFPVIALLSGSIPAWMLVIITPIYYFVQITFWYLVITYLKDIEIFGSSI